MGSDAHVVVVGGSTGSPALAHRRLDELEATSEPLPGRQRGQSPQRRVPAPRSRCPPRPGSCCTPAIEGIDLTGGRFDPTVLRDVEALGYDRSFDQLDRRGAAGQRAERVPRAPRGVRGSAAITLFDDRRSVRLAAGTGFDPGGIGKGLAADLVVAELLAEGAEGASVNVGGDVRAEGRSPTPDGWVVAVEDPWTRSQAQPLALRSGAVATGGRCERTWTRGGVEHHHLVDPGTGRSVDSGLAAVTVVAGEGWLAEVATKAAFVAGAAPLRAGAIAGVAALLVADDGTVEAVDMPGPGVAA